MIPYQRDRQQTIPSSSVKIIGLGGAGANMLERVTLDGTDSTEGAELLALNTDARTLAACVAGEKIQLGRNLTKGLGAGGDPDLGHQAMLESEEEIRLSLRGRQIVFLCVGLGGGTGSGAAPIITRIAREEGAFVVVFATMPFGFEGRRRREQAETALNELAVLSNALVTFDNNRMGELVLAKQGIHEAFSAADRMICESIKAVIRLVIRPGLINVGLDDLMSALRTNRSRCLFGSGLAKGKDRAHAALRNALASPLLDQGALLKQAETVLVHVCGGEDLTLYEVELLMQRLQKFVPDSAHVLFGAAIDPAMGEGISVTLISALPEDALATAPRDTAVQEEKDFMDPTESFVPTAPVEPVEPPTEEPAAFEPEPDTQDTAPEPPATPAVPNSLKEAAADIPRLFADDLPFAESVGEPEHDTSEPPAPDPAADTPAPKSLHPGKPKPKPKPKPTPQPTPEPEPPESSGTKVGPFTFNPVKRQAPSSPGLWGKTPKHKQEPPANDPFEKDLEAEPTTPEPPPAESPTPTKLKLGVKAAASQNELALDSTPRGRFEGQTPNVVDGEDLDLPPFLRKKK